MESKKLELKKHVACIHCSNHLTLLQRKISNVFLYKAYDDLLTKERHVIAMGELVKLIGYRSNDYALLKSSIKVLISTAIEWNLLSDDVEGQGSWHASAILASARIDGSICTYSYSTELRSLLYTPEIYGKINLSVQAKFKSSYALVLYENCVRYKNLSGTRWFDLDVFRKLMGVSEGQYLVFRDMKRKVIDKAISEVNAFSELNIAVETRREKQKVVSIRFLIKQKKESSALLQETSITHAKMDNQNSDNLVTQLMQVFNIPLSQSKKLINEYGYDFVANRAMLLEKSVKTGGKKIVNLAGYFIKSLHNEKELHNSKIDAKLQLEKKREKNDVIEQLKKSYTVYLNEKIFEKYYQLHKNEQELILQKFKSFLKKGVFFDACNKHGLNNVLVRDEFLRYILHEYSDFYKEFLSFHDFCAKG